MDKRQQYNPYINYLNPQPEPDQVLPPEVVAQPPAEAAPPQAAPVPPEVAQSAPPQTEEQVPPVPEEANQEQAVDFSGVDAAARAGYLESTAPGMVSQSKRLGKGPEGRAFRELTNPMTREGMAKVGGIAIAGAKREEELRLQGEKAAADEAAFIDGMEKRREIEAEQRAQKERNLADWNARTANIMREPDPSRYFNSATTGQKLSLGLMAIAGGWVKNKTGKNPVLEAVEKAMDQDLKSQKDLIDREERGLQYAKEGYAMGNEIFEDQLESNILDRADKLAASQAMLTRKIAELHKSAAPAETINMMEQAAAELDKQRAGLFVQFDEKKRAREQRAAAAREKARLEKAKADQEADKNRLYMLSVRGDKVPVFSADGKPVLDEKGQVLMQPARDRYVELYGASGDKEVGDAIAKREESRKKGSELRVTIPGSKPGEQLEFGDATDTGARDIFRKKIIGASSGSKTLKNIQRLAADAGWTDVGVVMEAAKRGDGNARQLIQQIAKLQGDKVDSYDFELGPRQLEAKLNEMGISQDMMAKMFTPEGFKAYSEMMANDVNDLVGAGGIILTDEGRRNLETMLGDIRKAGDMPATAQEAWGRRAKDEAALLSGRKEAASAGYDTSLQDKEISANFQETLGGLSADPTNTAYIDRAKQQVDAMRKAGYPEKWIADSILTASQNLDYGGTGWTTREGAAPPLLADESANASKTEKSNALAWTQVSQYLMKK